MKTIKIFLASSNELADEREKFGNLIRRLDDIYRKRGIHVQLLMWEDMDPCYNNVRKQDEYNAWIRKSHIFVCLFYKLAGKYTLEELDVAKAENTLRKEPRLMIYCRNLQDGEIESEELVEFKQALDKELGHFWGQFSTTDKLHLDFVFYFMRTEVGFSEALKVENGQVVIDGVTVANMDNLPFASENEEYKGMKQRLEALSIEVDQLWDAMQQAPGVEMLRNLHQQKLDEYNELKKKFSGYQQILFDTAKRISEMQLENVNNNLRRAIVEFENGHVEAANAILDIVERDADRHMEQLDCDKALVHQDIEALLLKTKTLMADLTITIEQRIDSVLAIYQKVDFWAEQSTLNKKKYAKLLADYGKFLFDYAKYHQALSILQRASRMNEELYSIEHPDTATSYYNIGLVYNSLGEYDQALEYHLRAMTIREKIFGHNHPDTALSYNDIGLVHYNQANPDKALDYITKALTIREKVFGVEHRDTAESYTSIGAVYLLLGDYDKTLEYNQKALAICEKELGIEHRDTAASYHCIGLAYDGKGDYDKSLEYHQKALFILEKVLGTEHRDTAASYNSIGLVFQNRGELNKALEYDLKALSVFEKVLGTEHPDTASSYSCLANVYKLLGNYDKAIEYNQIAMSIREKVFGEKNIYTAASYNEIGEAYLKQRDYDTAINCFQKALAISEEVYGAEPPVVGIYNNIGSAFFHKNNYDMALEYFLKALAIKEKLLGTEHPKTLESYKIISAVYEYKGDDSKMVEYLMKEFNAKIKKIIADRDNE